MPGSTGRNMRRHGSCKLLCRPGKRLHLHKSGKSGIPAPELYDRAISGLAQGLGPRSFEPLHPKLGHHHSTLPEQPDHVLLSDGRSSGYNQRQERRWSFLLGGYVLHCGEVPPGIKITRSDINDLYARCPGVAILYLQQSEYVVQRPDRRYRPVSGGGELHTESGTESPRPGPDRLYVRLPMYRPMTTSSVKGLHTFTVKATDSGGNVNVKVVIYNVR